MLLETDLTWSSEYKLWQLQFYDLLCSDVVCGRDENFRTE